MTSNSAQLYLFGGEKSWSSDEWTSQDDTVRGGVSVSHLNITPSSPVAVFNGNLDIKTLGGAGFASQRTVGEDNVWDLSKYDGLEISTANSDNKRYTFTLKDELLPKRSDGREQSAVSWEYDFNSSTETKDHQSGDKKVFFAWKDLNATYRGRDWNGTKPLDLTSIKRFSIMMRSFFGTQEGEFSLSIRSIAAIKKHSELVTDRGAIFIEPYRDDPEEPNVEKSTHMERGSDNGKALAARGCLGSCIVS